MHVLTGYAQTARDESEEEKGMETEEEEKASDEIELRIDDSEEHCKEKETTRSPKLKTMPLLDADKVNPETGG